MVQKGGLMPIQTNAIVTHTPGPWRVHQVQLIGTTDAENIVHSVEASPMGQPAIVAPEIWGSSNAMRLANARLIAAGPELLQALKEVVAIADRRTVEFDRARAAIAKAEGGAP